MSMKGLKKFRDIMRRRKLEPEIYTYAVPEPAILTAAETPRSSFSSKTRSYSTAARSSPLMSPVSDSESTLASLKRSVTLDRGADHFRPNRKALTSKPTYELTSPKWHASLHEIVSDSYIRPFIELSTRTTADQKLYAALLSQSIAPHGDWCPLCYSLDDSIEHWFHDCPATQRFSSFLQRELSRSFNLAVDPISLRDLVFFFPNLRSFLSHEELRTLASMHSLALMAIFSSRRAHQHLSMDNIETRRNSVLNVDLICEIFVALNLQRKLESEGIFAFENLFEDVKSERIFASGELVREAESERTVPELVVDAKSESIISEFKDKKHLSVDAHWSVFTGNDVEGCSVVIFEDEEEEEYDEEEEDVDVERDLKRRDSDALILFEGSPESFLRRRGKFFLDGVSL